MIDNAVYNKEEADVVFLGLNYYETCGEKGNGPELIREVINLQSSYDMTTGKDFFDELKICDLGDIKTKNYDELRKKTIEKLKGVKGTIIMLGGEHLVTLPVIEALKPENVLVLDAHADYYNEYNNNKHSYAAVTRRISEIAKKVVIAGVRDAVKQEMDDLKLAKNVKLIKFEDITKEVKTGNWYVSIDLDVLDPIYCPEVSTPVPMGVTYESLVNVLNKICLHVNLVGLDIVELTASNKGLSSTTAGGIIMNYLKRRCNT